MEVMLIQGDPWNMAVIDCYGTGMKNQQKTLFVMQRKGNLFQFKRSMYFFFLTNSNNPPATFQSGDSLASNCIWWRSFHVYSSCGTLYLWNPENGDDK